MPIRWSRGSEERRSEEREERKEVGTGGSERVAVGKEYPPRVGVGRQAAADVLLHLSETADAETLLFVRGTEDTLVVRTPDGVLEDQAVGLAGRPYDDAFIFGHISLPCQAPQAACLQLVRNLF